MKKKCLLCSLITILFILTILPGVAFAYIDPGTGSMVLQALAVAVFSSLFFIKKILRSIKLFFKKDKSDNGDFINENKQN
ncbi:MAG: hypothetical protein ACFFD1_11930 [Candidatus Thorarchaeota archaeon]